MTDEQKALVERLRSNRPLPTLPHEAADLIEAQAAENARLREALYRLGKAGQAIAETFTAYEELRDLDGTEMLWLMTDYGSVGKNLGQELMAALMQANEAYGEVG
jgi:hypothetical protein